MIQMDYFILVSTEDYIAAAFTYVRRWLSGSNDLWGDQESAPMELIETHADRKKVQTHLSQETANE